MAETLKVESPSVRERIVRISNEIRISKEGKNEFTRSGYFQPDDILRAINPLLEKYNLITLFNMTWSKEKEMYQGNLGIQDISGRSSIEYFFDIPMHQLKGNAGAAQNAGATQTYCKRYMFMNAFNLADNKADPDANKVSNKLDYSDKLKATKSLEELKKVFASLPQQAKAEMFVLKETLKKKYENTKV